MQGEFAAQVCEEHVGHLGQRQAVFVAHTVFEAAFYCSAARVRTVEDIHRHIAASLFGYSEEIEEPAIDGVEAVACPLSFDDDSVDMLFSQSGGAELSFIQKHNIPSSAGYDFPKVAFYLWIPCGRAVKHGKAAF